jgi:hypothetical protein
MTPTVKSEAAPPLFNALDASHLWLRSCRGGLSARSRVERGRHAAQRGGKTVDEDGVGGYLRFMSGMDGCSFVPSHFRAVF